MCMPDTYTRMHMQAFARGQRAIYTSPIKALSNQKFAEFKEWFRKKGVRGEVSLLTGDIKIRAPPGTRNELIICTSEILRNKLVKASGAAPPADAAVVAPAADGGGQMDGLDPDLVRLGCVVSDEVHYINDPERGAVWEETLMHLGRDVQLVALSATLRRSALPLSPSFSLLFLSLLSLSLPRLSLSRALFSSRHTPDVASGMRI